MGKSMIDVAYELLSKKKKPVAFGKLWDEVSQTMGYTVSQAENKIANFYSDLMLDNHFVSLPDNMWDLRTRHKFEDVKLELDAIVIEEDEDEIEEVEESEQAEEESEEQF